MRAWGFDERVQPHRTFVKACDARIARTTKLYARAMRALRVQPHRTFVKARDARSPARETAGNTIGGDWFGHVSDAPVTRAEVRWMDVLWWDNILV